MESDFSGRLFHPLLRSRGVGDFGRSVLRVGVLNSPGEVLNRGQELDWGLWGLWKQMHAVDIPDYQLFDWKR